jgi:phosphoribosylanthranilate isomerase
MLVQIYEVQTSEEAVALVRLGVDHIGVLVGDGMFPRELSIAQTNAIFAAVPAGRKRVALSLCADLEEIARVVRETQPDIIQLQAPIDDFSVAMTRALKTRFPEILILGGRFRSPMRRASRPLHRIRAWPTFCCSTAGTPAPGSSGRSAGLTIGA